MPSTGNTCTVSPRRAWWNEKLRPVVVVLPWPPEALSHPAGNMSASTLHCNKQATAALTKSAAYPAIDFLVVSIELVQLMVLSSWVFLRFITTFFLDPGVKGALQRFSPPN